MQTRMHRKVDKLVIW